MEDIIFRTKNIRTNKYVEGAVIPYDKEFCYIMKMFDENYLNIEAIKCYKSTLAIHLPYMKYKKLKFFASLQEDGLGGDIYECEYSRDMGQYSLKPIKKVDVCIFDTKNDNFTHIFNDTDYTDIKIVGINI